MARAEGPSSAASTPGDSGRLAAELLEAMNNPKKKQEEVPCLKDNSKFVFDSHCNVIDKTQEKYM